MTDVRYRVLPQQPEGTASWTEAALAALITRDAMIGVAQAAPPLTTSVQLPTNH
jgi:nitrile hydratase